MDYPDKNLDRIKQQVMSFLDNMDTELSRHLADLKAIINEFPGLKTTKINRGREWSVTFSAAGEEGLASIGYAADIFAKNPDLNVAIDSAGLDGSYVLTGQDPEIVTIWLAEALQARLASVGRTLH